MATGRFDRSGTDLDRQRVILHAHRLGRRRRARSLEVEAPVLRQTMNETKTTTSARVSATVRGREGVSTDLCKVDRRFLDSSILLQPRPIHQHDRSSTAPILARGEPNEDLAPDLSREPSVSVLGDELEQLALRRRQSSLDRLLLRRGEEG